jgi:hypothetical protein
MEVIERLSLGCGGDKLDEFHSQDNRCPKCGYAIRMHGQYVPPPKERMVTE